MLNRGRSIALLLVVIACAGVLRAADRKPAWEWSAAERIARRTDPAVVRGLKAADAGVGAALRGDAIRIEGRGNPELLLPIELFRNLLSGLADPRGREVLREAYAPVATKLGLGDDFIDELAVIAAEYLARNAQIQSMNASLGRGAPNHDRLRLTRDALAALQCPTLADALAAARRRYGRATVDRFLYEAIAPGMVVVLLEPESADELARWEGGCK